MISFVPSTPIGFGLFLLILALGPKRGLPVFFASMPFGATAVFSGAGIGNIVLQDFCAMAYVVSAFTRMRIDDLTAAIWPGRPGFSLLVLSVSAILGVWFLPVVFAGKTSVYAIQFLDGRAFINLISFTPSGGQTAQLVRFLLGALVFLAIASVRWRLRDGHYALKALIAASSAHVIISFADWISFPLGLAYILEPVRTISQAILLDQHFGAVRRLIGGHTEPASFGLYTIGLFGFWLRLHFTRPKPVVTPFFLSAMAFLALRSTSSATFVNMMMFSTVLMLWQCRRIARGSASPSAPVYLLCVLPGVVACVVWFLETLPSAQTLADAMFFDKASSISGQERSSWNAQAWQNFKDSYGLGLGIGSVRASGWVFAVLGNLGLPGAIAFVWFLVSAMRIHKPQTMHERRPANVASALRWGCVAVLMQSILTTPYPNLGLPFFAMLGVAVGLDQARQRGRFSPSRRAAPRPIRRSVFQ